MDQYEKAAREAGWDRVDHNGHFIAPIGHDPRVVICDSWCELCDLQDIAPAPLFYSVCLFRVTRQYGGPEEGGWWYDAGEPCIEDAMEILGNDGLPTLHVNVEDAIARANVLRERIKDYRGYEVRVCDEFPTAFPETRPYYE